MNQHRMRMVVLPLVFAMQIVNEIDAEDRAADQTHPHIVLILSDDMGYGDLKTYNAASQITTPHLDRLAKAGMTFTDAHSGGATCRPSRYSLMTGRFSVRADSLRDRQGPVIAEGCMTLASLLKDNGYTTAMIGKWHLGFEQTSNEKEGGFGFDYDQPLAGGPMDRGFDSFFGMHASLDIPPYFFIRDRAPTMPPTDTTAASTSVGGEEGWNNIQGAFWRQGPVAPDFKHAEVTPRFAQEATKVIEAHGVDGDTRPLFLYLALPSPHTPWLPTKQFAGKSGAGTYGDFVMQVDSVVGRVMHSLEKAGMTRNTLVIFSSDNGPVWYDKDTERFQHRSAGPLRGIKGSVWEGGHRVPFIVSWPERIRAGSVSKHVIAFADVFATFAELVGHNEITPETAEDSVSFLSHLLGDAQNGQGRPPILHSKGAIRDGKWKLILRDASRGFGVGRDVAKTTELYNLDEDIAETNNLAPVEPERVERLKKKINEILDQ